MSSRRQRRAERMQEYHENDDGIRYQPFPIWAIDKTEPTYRVGPLVFGEDYSTYVIGPKELAEHRIQFPDAIRDLATLTKEVLEERNAEAVEPSLPDWLKAKNAAAAKVRAQRGAPEPPASDQAQTPGTIEALNPAAAEIRAHRKGQTP